ncbi:hypothetical protein H5410_041126 [Solanum commersonii]|uniref:Fungal lipase-type domain-containing protein n=1 Tax=Solanum commersonii TaxID=4109 RepID=A0A9J5XTL0_SOLCO|nr:hypothetical protein H5410_041126 [Solanum commersonii]
MPQWLERSKLTYTWSKDSNWIGFVAVKSIGHMDSKAEHGFLSIYTSKCDSIIYNKSSASEQVMKELKTLVDFYKTKGGALALLNAYESATNFPKLPISVISFAAPRVGNIAFRNELY